jgi:hypothetical protein
MDIQSRVILFTGFKIRKCGSLGFLSREAVGVAMFLFLPTGPASSVTLQNITAYDLQSRDPTRNYAFRLIDQTGQDGTRKAFSKLTIESSHFSNSKNMQMVYAIGPIRIVNLINFTCQNLSAQLLPPDRRSLHRTFASGAPCAEIHYETMNMRNVSLIRVQSTLLPAFVMKVSNEVPVVMTIETLLVKENNLGAEGAEANVLPFSFFWSISEIKDS